MDNIAFIIQARVGSNRLPGKMLIPFFEGKTILEILIEKIKKNFSIPIILATSTNQKDDCLEDVANKNQIFFFRGNENDVLDRFINATAKFNIDSVIRVCADNPFLDVLELKKLLDFAKHTTHQYDYISFKINNTPSIKTHFGFWAEIVSYQALKKVVSLTNDAYYQEHVTNYIYEHEAQFTNYFLNPNPIVLKHNQIRLTVDTAEDFTLTQEIYSSLVSLHKDNFGILEIITFLKEKQIYLTQMNNQIIKNTK